MSGCRRDCAYNPNGGLYSKCEECCDNAQANYQTCSAKRTVLGIKKENKPDQCCPCHSPAKNNLKSKDGVYSRCAWCLARDQVHRTFNISLEIKHQRSPKLGAGSSAAARSTTQVYNSILSLLLALKQFNRFAMI